MGVERNIDEAYKWYILAADQCSVRAYNRIGWIYYTGVWGSFKKDYAEAAKWYQLSADQGDYYGQYQLGNCYLEQHKVKEALTWLNRSAEQGYGPAHYQIAEIYFNGKSVIQNYKEAFKHYKLASDLRYEWAIDKLAQCYYDGYGTSVDKTEAYFWWLICSAEFGIEEVKTKRDKVAQELTSQQRELIQNRASKFYEEFKEKPYYIDQ